MVSLRKAKTKEEATQVLSDLGLPLAVRPLSGSWPGGIARTKREFHHLWNCAYRMGGGATITRIG